MYEIRTLACLFCDHISNDINHVGIVACTANQCIRTRTSIEGVIASCTGQGVVGGITREHIVQGVARAVDDRRSRQGQVFYVRAQCVVDGALDEVRSLVGQLGNDIASFAHNKSVVARAADQCVIVRTAIQKIIAFTAIEHVAANTFGDKDVVEVGADGIQDAPDIVAEVVYADYLDIRLVLIVSLVFP
ncbi:hypothetical protein D9M72_210360 [compost metagenome]